MFMRKFGNIAKELLKYTRPGCFIGHLDQSLQEQMMLLLHELLKNLDKIGNLLNRFGIALKTLTELT